MQHTSAGSLQECNFSVSLILHLWPPILQEYANWEASLRRVVAVNLEPSNTWWASLNGFSGMSWEEFKATKLGEDFEEPLIESSAYVNSSSEAEARRRELLADPDPAKDWVQLDKTTPVKDQGRVRVSVLGLRTQVDCKLINRFHTPISY